MYDDGPCCMSDIPVDTIISKSTMLGMLVLYYYLM